MIAVHSQRQWFQEMEDANIQPAKDEDSEHPIADAWRPTLRQVVTALAKDDYDMLRGIAGVAPMITASVNYIRANIRDYGETLTALADDTWSTSVARWMGTHWEVLVDLSTEECVRSDLVLHLLVFETSNGWRFEISSVHVP